MTKMYKKNKFERNFFAMIIAKKFIILVCQIKKGFVITVLRNGLPIEAIVDNNLIYELDLKQVR